VRELRTPGSVRGVLGNGHPYRDRAPHRPDVRLQPLPISHHAKIT